MTGGTDWGREKIVGKEPGVSGMVVMKFGGTSVADRAAIERLMAIVRA